MTESSRNHKGKSVNKERQNQGGRSRSGRGGKRSGKREYAAIPTRAASREAIKLDLEDGRFIVFDIETTGGNPERNGITEICALRYEGGEIVDRMCTLVNPKVPIPPIVRRMTGINDRMVRNAPTIDKVMPEFLEFIGNDVLVSHNTISI